MANKNSPFVVRGGERKRVSQDLRDLVAIFADMEQASQKKFNEQEQERMKEERDSEAALRREDRQFLMQMEMSRRKDEQDFQMRMMQMQMQMFAQMNESMSHRSHSSGTFGNAPHYQQQKVDDEKDIGSVIREAITEL